MTTEPNRYGLMAMAHMAQYLPARYGQLEDPDYYFATVGREVVEEINTAMAAWEATQAKPVDPAVRNMTRLSVEEMVLAELVFLTPEPDPDEPEIDQWGVAVGPTPGMGPWTPIWTPTGLTQADMDEIDEEMRTGR